MLRGMKKFFRRIGRFSQERKRKAAREVHCGYDIGNKSCVVEVVVEAESNELCMSASRSHAMGHCD